jgi:sortase A
VKLATLTIPRIGLKVDLLEGVTLTVIDQATGHWPGTPAPGGLGNMVIAGHRTVKQHPFERLDELKPGDPVIFDTADGHRYTYQVRGTIIVPASSLGIISQSDAHTATLFACHPLGQATQRIVVKLRLLDDHGQPVDPDSALPPMDVGNRPVDNTALVRAPATDPQSSDATVDDPTAGTGADPLSPSATEG